MKDLYFDNRYWTDERWNVRDCVCVLCLCKLDVGAIVLKYSIHCVYIQTWTWQSKISFKKCTVTICAKWRHVYAMMPENGLAPNERYHTLNTATSRFWTATILHWTVYTWRWCMYIFLFGGAVRTCLRSLTAGKIPIMSELFPESKPIIERRPQILKDTFRCPLLCQPS